MKIYLAIGSTDDFRVNLFTRCGANRVLVSYATIRGKAKVNLPFEDVLLDSGAYSVETGVEKVSLESYILWLQLYLSKYPQITRYVNLDDLSDYRISLQNLEKMHSEGLDPIPVYHYGEPPEVLDMLCTSYEYVGLGGIAVGTMPVQQLQKFWEHVYRRYPDNKFHIFGVGTVTPFFYCQPYSIDSTSWNVGSRFGDIMCYKDGLPYRFAAREMYGYQMFFTTEEMFANNIRAQIDWEKCEWLKNVPSLGGQQTRIFSEVIRYKGDTK